MAYVKGYDPIKRELYGIHFTGECYIMIKLTQNPEDVFQLDDTLWSTISGKSEIIKSTDITDLKNNPVRHLTTEYAGLIFLNTYINNDENV